MNLVKRAHPAGVSDCLVPSRRLGPPQVEFIALLSARFYLRSSEEPAGDQAARCPCRVG